MDLTPDITIAPRELSQRTKQRAAAILASAGIADFSAVAGAFWADILFVTQHSRESHDATSLESLAKASHGLGYAPASFALLDNYHAQLRLDIYLQALSSNTLVFLEAETAKSAELAEYAHELHSSFIQTVVVGDFFASLKPGADQKERKLQAWKELQAARLQPAMR